MSQRERKTEPDALAKALGDDAPPTRAVSARARLGHGDLDRRHKTTALNPDRSDEESRAIRA
jgi:hypothetical protein